MEAAHKKLEVEVVLAVLELALVYLLPLGLHTQLLSAQVVLPHHQVVGQLAVILYLAPSHQTVEVVEADTQIQMALAAVLAVEALHLLALVPLVILHPQAHHKEIMEGVAQAKWG